MPGMRYQPQGLARVSGKGIASWMVFSIQAGTGLRDVMRWATQSSRGANQAIRAFPGGLAFDCRNVATAGYVNVADGVSQLVSDQTVIFDMIVSGAPAGSLPAFGGLWRSTSQNDAMLVIERPSADVVQVAFRIGGATSTRTFSAGLSALYGQRLIVAASIARGQNGRSVWLRIASEGRIIFDQETPYNAAGSSDVTPGGGEYISIGSEQIENPSRNPNCIIYSQHHFGRVVTADEVASLSRMPWQVYDDPDDEESAGGAPVVVERRLVVEAAALGINVSPVGMTVARRLPVAPAALTAAGGSVAMRAARRLRVQAAALATAGGEVSVCATRRINVQPAALDLLVGQVQLAVSRRLGVQPAALALTGHDLAMRAARRMRVEPAALVVAGQGAALRAGRRLQVAPAALVLAGGAVAMQYNPALIPGEYTLPVSAAAMTLGGGNVGMRVSRRVPVAGAGLVLAQGAARMLVGRRLVVSSAALTTSTGSIGMRTARRMRVQAAQVVLAGGNVQLRYSSQIEYARAPAGAGYAPQRAAVTARPAQAGGERSVQKGGHRPPAIQETTR